MGQRVQAYTVAEAAKELGVTPTTIYGWLKTGDLADCEMVQGRIQLVTAASVEAMKRAREEGRQ